MIKFPGYSEWNGFGQGHRLVIVPMPCDNNAVGLCASGELLELPHCFFKLFFKPMPAGGPDFPFSENGQNHLSFGSFESWLSRQLTCRARMGRQARIYRILATWRYVRRLRR